MKMERAFTWEIIEIIKDDSVEEMNFPEFLFCFSTDESEGGLGLKEGKAL